VTLTDDLHDTAAALRSGWPIENLNRARRVRAEEQRTMSDDMGELKDLIERATPILRELRRACGNEAKFDTYDPDLAAALLAVDPDALVSEFRPGMWEVVTPEFRLCTDTKPERAP